MPLLIFFNSNINTIWFGNNIRFADFDADIGEFEPDGIFDGSTIKQIVLPNTMHTISKNMFRDCINLESLSFIGSAPNVLPSYITTIREGAFKGCGLPELAISATDATVGRNVFAGWTEEQIVKVPFTEAEDAPVGWDAQWYGGNGNPLYKELPPANSYKITYYIKVDGDKWYEATSTYKPENGTNLAGFSNGYSYFSGWKDNINFTGSTYTSIPAETTGDKTYYAEMTTIKYTLKFYLNGTLYNSTTYTIFDSVFFLIPPFYANFSGWHLGNIYGTVYSGIPQGTYGNYNFYATGTYNRPIIDIPDYPGPGNPGPGNPDFPIILPPDIIIVPPTPRPPTSPMSMSIGSSSESGDSEETVCETECENEEDTSEQEPLPPEEPEDNNFVLKKIILDFII